MFKIERSAPPELSVEETKVLVVEVPKSVEGTESIISVKPQGLFE